MIVGSLWRFRNSPLIEPALGALITDPAVARHAMSALRRSIGPATALPYLRQVAADHPGDRLGKTAVSKIRRAEAANSRKQPPTQPWAMLAHAADKVPSGPAETRESYGSVRGCETILRWAMTVPPTVSCAQPTW